ncbi:MAG TPA: DUF4406 domain-containing protein [Desulfatiglandales bacterium]|nr:DUF4406 domain-containing protein [Desulfatiglandales bacterium]
MKIVYIAHPIGGDVENNLAKVLKIVRDININMPDVLPFAPYWIDCHALDDNVPEERNRGIKNDQTLMKAGFINEVWLFGDRISTGMSHEIKLAGELGIPVIPMTEQTQTRK